jgi:CRP/FNR family transcriptional regulator, cAMP and macrophage regulator
MLGAQRPSLNQVLKDLERDGLIGIGYAAIEILDRAGPGWQGRGR